MEPHSLCSRFGLLSVASRHTSDGAISIKGSCLPLASLLFTVSRLLDRADGRSVNNKVINI